MQLRRTLTLTLSLFERERGTFGGTASGSLNRDPRRERSSSPLPARSRERIKVRGASDCIVTLRLLVHDLGMPTGSAKVGAGKAELKPFAPKPVKRL